MKGLVNNLEMWHCLSFSDHHLLSTLLYMSSDDDTTHWENFDCNGGKKYQKITVKKNKNYCSAAISWLPTHVLDGSLVHKVSDIFFSSNVWPTCETISILRGVKVKEVNSYLCRILASTYSHGCQYLDFNRVQITFA